jgi:hypothetical protein
MIRIVYPISRIRIFFVPSGSGPRIQGSKKHFTPDPGPQHRNFLQVSPTVHKPLLIMVVTSKLPRKMKTKIDAACDFSTKTNFFLLKTTGRRKKCSACKKNITRIIDKPL